MLAIGARVLAPPPGGGDGGDGGGAPSLIVARLEALGVDGDAARALVAITPEGETAAVAVAALRRPPTAEERREEQAEAAAAAAAGADAARRRADAEEAAAARAAASSRAGDGAPATSSEDPTDAAATAATEAATEPTESDAASVEVLREEYRPPLHDDFEAAERAARAALAARDAEKLSRAAEPEPPGIDAFVRVEALPRETINGVDVPVVDAPGGGGAADGGAAAPRPLVQSLVVAERVGRGYDLVRVGNFTEQGGGGAVADIAFFHDRATLDAFVADARADERAGRARCVRECCGALRDVCDGVFGVDAARVTLFYAPGALSRFVRQKLLFNVEPVEQRKRARALRDAREDAFVCVGNARARRPRAALAAWAALSVDPTRRSTLRARYAYFFGLCVHKLAHFFDVVHGTRHDFFMAEYRAVYMAKWVALLCARGFDPAEVEREFPSLLWEVTN